MKRLAALVLPILLAGCASADNGPARLTGQDLGAAVALYGDWTEQVTLDGQPTYIWRRTLLVDGEPRVCELRVQLGFHRAITRTLLQGVPDACRLYALHTEALTN